MAFLKIVILATGVFLIAVYVPLLVYLVVKAVKNKGPKDVQMFGIWISLFTLITGFVQVFIYFYNKAVGDCNYLIGTNAYAVTALSSALVAHWIFNSRYMYTAWRLPLILG